MKKFLTVLLVIAVMFTFSFGSAFAATSTSDFNGYVNLAEQQVLTEGSAAYDSAEKLLAKKDGIDVAAWKVALDAHEEDFVAATKVKTNEIKAAYDANATYTVAGIYALYTKANAATILSEVATGKYLDKAAAAQFPVTKAAELAKLDTVDTTLYSAEVKKGDDYSYRAIVEKYIADQKEAIEAIVLDTDPTAAEVTTALGDIAAKLTGIVEILDEEGEKTGVYKLTDAQKATLKVVTLETEEAQAVTLEAQKAVKLSKIATASADLYAQAVAAGLTKDALADFQADRAAYVEMATYLVEVAESAADLAFGEPTTIAAIANHAELKAAYEGLEAYADKYAAETKDGALVRDAEKVAKVLATAKKDIYTTCDDSRIPAYKAQIKNECYVGNLVDEFAREVAIAAVEAARKTALKSYYELEQADVNAAYDAVVAKLEAAVTDVEMAKVDTTPDLSKIATKTAVNNKIVVTVTAEFAKIAKYYDYTATGLSAAEDASRDANYVARMDADDNGAVDAADWTVWYAKAGARSAAEVKAMYAQAEAEINALATKAELDAEKAAVEAQIAALPATVTAADEAAVVAAKEAADDYKAEGRNDIANEATLNLAIKALADAQAKEIKAAHKALPAVTKVTIADKAAVQAVADMIEAYNDANDSGEVFAGMYADSAYDVAGLLAKIKTLEAQAVIDAVNALPLNIDLEDKAAVEAARAAYDAYVAEYSNAKTPVDARLDLVSIAKELVDAEEAIEVAMAEAAESVESLKITAKSSAKKGSITVKWTVKGDTAAVQGYEIWKSTKKNSGFKKMFTTEKTSYKNTKGLKKGTRYYYKVRAIAYDVDGNKVKSDWSNKAYRVAK